MRRLLLATVLLSGFASLGHAAVGPSAPPTPATSADQDGNIQFTFGGTSSVKVAPVGTVAGGSSCASSVAGSTMEGAIRYNRTLKSFEGCDGVRWRSFSDFDTRQWVSVKAARAFGVPYINNTGQAIEVSLMTFSGCIPGGGLCPITTPYPNPSPAHCAASLSVNGIQVAYQFSNTAVGQNSMCNVKAVVPAGASYSGGNDGWPTNDIYLYEWAELR